MATEAAALAERRGPELGARPSAARPCSGRSSGARPPGGQLMWQKQVSRPRQAPSRRPAPPGTSCTSGYLCLRFSILCSRALPQGSPRGHVTQGLGRADTVAREPAGMVPPPHRGFQMQPFGGTLGDKLLPLWGWVLLETLIVVALLQSQGSAGSSPNFETHCSVLERSEKYPQILVSSHVSSSCQPVVVGLAQALPGCRGVSCSTGSRALLWQSGFQAAGSERTAPTA